MFYCRARIFPQKAAPAGSARGIALSRPMESGAFRYSEKSRAAFHRLRAQRGLDSASMPRATITRGFLGNAP